jgi:gamma-glutamyltranspeptidase/glutathione hydrolase
MTTPEIISGMDENSAEERACLPANTKWQRKDPGFKAVGFGGRAGVLVLLIVSFAINMVRAGSQPIRSGTGMVVSASAIASEVGAQTLKDGGTAVDAAIATAFALAVTHPSAGNIGGGGFLLYRSTSGQAVAYDFREAAPAGASSEMFMKNGVYDQALHHNSYLAVGVPGTVAGLYLAWNDQGAAKHLSWPRLVEPAARLARDGFTVSDGLARSLKVDLLQQTTNEAAVAQFTQNGKPCSAGDTLKQPALAATLERIARQGPAGFYEGETARAIDQEMRKNGGLITLQDLKDYKAQRRTDVIKGAYRGYEVISMPPPSSGGVGLVEMLNVLEGYDLAGMGRGSATNVHRMVEAMKRAYADRAHYLGDPYTPFNTNMPLARLLSKEYAAELRKTISATNTNPSSTNFAWPNEGGNTTHLSVVDQAGNAVSLTYTLEEGYGVKVVVPGAGFLLNNELGDFNAAPGLTTTGGLIGTTPNLAQPRKRPLSSMTPAILAKDGRLFMVTGSPGGRTIIATVLHTIINVVDFGMNAQEAVDAGRFYHQWLPDEITYERPALSPDAIQVLHDKMGHARLREIKSQGVAEVIIFNAANRISEGGIDRRQPDGGAAFP